MTLLSGEAGGQTQRHHSLRNAMNTQSDEFLFKSREFSPAELEAKQMLSPARRPLLCDYYFHVLNFQLSGACQ